MDKEFTLHEVWLWALVGTVVGFTMTRFRWWLVFVSLPLTVFKPLAPVLECHDPHIGIVIVREAGRSYAVQAHLGLVLVLVANGLGLVLCLNARHRKARQGQ